MFYLFMKCIFFLNNFPKQFSFRHPKSWFINAICCWHTLSKLINLVSVCLLSHCSRVQLFATPWTVAHQASLSMRFSRREYWSELPCQLQGSSQPRDQTQVSQFSCVGRQVLYPLYHHLWSPLSLLARLQF